ncbi:tetratricopeptide repeat protein [Leptospira sp. GIMC2001]|uniref:tetratricopeptide repeat protein n=1 Tax=Leptospira sp. GIMC2001 TaxID=1513297 RepID=UPI00234A32CE|nr:tetratricopeptide repeat protein [Leptospira sp. GIMC2001]WCL49034.1 tetratricopeptide repeat protein [Leptospira sp. GIMC2001]
MSNRQIIIGSIIVVLLFLMISKSIISIKLFEMRTELTHSQMMNYEFSSQALRKRYKELLFDSDNFDNEIRNTILDSLILNEEFTDSSTFLNRTEWIGMGLVNIIRFLSFKKFLDIEVDRWLIMHLQYAFQLEKDQKFKSAAKHYDILEKESIKLRKDDQSFILLHNAYCYAMMGRLTKAMEKLEYILENNPGTHFSDNALILNSILKEKHLESYRINSKLLNHEEKVKSLYESGLYSQVLEELKNRNDLNDEEAFMQARSFEKTGEDHEAIKAYLKLIERTDNLPIAKKSNRRLLIMGNFYSGGRTLTRIAESVAIKLSDERMVNNIKSCVALKKESLLLNNLNYLRINNSITKENAENIIQSIENLQSSISQENESFLLPNVNKKKFIKSSTKPLLLNTNRNGAEQVLFQILLIDQRSYNGYSLVRELDNFKILTTKYPIVFPIDLLESIELQKVNFDKNRIIEITTISNQKFAAKSIKFFSGIAKFNQNGTEQKLDQESIQSIRIK